jgi:hypothetical protein
MLYTSQKKRRKSKPTRKMHQTVIPVHLTRGKLSEFNYNLHESAQKRHHALDRAVAVYGPLSVFRSVNILGVYNKYRNPALLPLVEDDKQYIRHRYMVQQKTGGSRQMGQRSQAAKFERCVMDVKSQKRQVNPWAVCHASVGQGQGLPRQKNAVVPCQAVKMDGYPCQKYAKLMHHGGKYAVCKYHSKHMGGFWGTTGFASIAKNVLATAAPALVSAALPYAAEKAADLFPSVKNLYHEYTKPTPSTLSAADLPGASQYAAPGVKDASRILTPHEKEAIEAHKRPKEGEPSFLSKLLKSGAHAALQTAAQHFVPSSQTTSERVNESRPQTNYATERALQLMAAKMRRQPVRRRGPAREYGRPKKRRAVMKAKPYGRKKSRQKAPTLAQVLRSLKY